MAPATAEYWFTPVTGAVTPGGKVGLDNVVAMLEAMVETAAPPAPVPIVAAESSAVLKPSCQEGAMVLAEMLAPSLAVRSSFSRGGW